MTDREEKNSKSTGKRITEGARAAKGKVTGPSGGSWTYHPKGGSSGADGGRVNLPTGPTPPGGAPQPKKKD